MPLPFQPSIGKSQSVIQPELNEIIPTSRSATEFLYLDGSLVNILTPVPYELSSTSVSKFLKPYTTEIHKSGALSCYWITCMLGSQFVSKVGSTKIPFIFPSFVVIPPITHFASMLIASLISY